MTETNGAVFMLVRFHTEVEGQFSGNKGIPVTICIKRRVYVAQRNHV